MYLSQLVLQCTVNPLAPHSVFEASPHSTLCRESCHSIAMPIWPSLLPSHYNDSHVHSASSDTVQHCMQPASCTGALHCTQVKSVCGLHAKSLAQCGPRLLLAQQKQLRKVACPRESRSGWTPPHQSQLHELCLCIAPLALTLKQSPTTGHFYHPKAL